MVVIIRIDESLSLSSNFSTARLIDHVGNSAERKTRNFRHWVREREVDAFSESWQTQLFLAPIIGQGE